MLCLYWKYSVTAFGWPACSLALEIHVLPLFYKEVQPSCSQPGRPSECPGVVFKIQIPKTSMIIMLESALVPSLCALKNPPKAFLMTGLIWKPWVRVQWPAHILASFSSLPSTAVPPGTRPQLSCHLHLTKDNKSIQFWAHAALRMLGGHLNIVGNSVLTRHPMWIEAVMCD